MSTEIKLNVSDYLSHEEIKDLCIEQVKHEIQKFFRDEENAQRLLYNLSYQFVFDEIDKVIPNSRELIVSKTMEVLNKIESYHVFRHHYSSDVPQSTGAKIINQCVINNHELINDKVKETIINRDYSEEIWSRYEELADSFMSNFYEIVRLGREKSKSNG